MAASKTASATLPIWLLTSWPFSCGGTVAVIYIQEVCMAYTMQPCHRLQYMRRVCRLKQDMYVCSSNVMTDSLALRRGLMFCTSARWKGRTPVHSSDNTDWRWYCVRLHMAAIYFIHGDRIIEQRYTNVLVIGIAWLNFAESHVCVFNSSVWRAVSTSTRMIIPRSTIMKQQIHVLYSFNTDHKIMKWLHITILFCEVWEWHTADSWRNDASALQVESNWVILYPWCHRSHWLIS